MSADSPNDLPLVDQAGGPCRHLRNKGMYVYTDGSGGEPHEGYESPHWCLKTMTHFGPDDDMVGATDCRQTGRSCYQSI